MKQGSIVELTRQLSSQNREILYKSGISLHSNTPYVVKEGPKYKQWENPKRIVTAILLEEYPWEWLDVSYFSEVQPPQQISIEEIVGSMTPAMVCAAL